VYLKYYLEPKRRDPLLASEEKGHNSLTYMYLLDYKEQLVTDMFDANSGARMTTPENLILFGGGCNGVQRASYENAGFYR
jgi:hypothetical protein